MNSKILKAITGAAILGIMTAASLQGSPAQAAGYVRHNINHREWNQQHRIFRGVRNDSLTNREATHLEKREIGIDRAEARDRRSGGKFTQAERHNIEQRENRTSRAIYHQKHDRQVR